jgi:AcrR family transcriptional regulator
MEAATAEAVVPLKLSKAEQTRRDIYAGAIACVETWGLEKTTLDDIAKAAGCSRRTLYNHFSNKSEVMAEALDAAGEQFRLRVIGHAMQFEEPAVSLVETMVYTIVHLPREPYLKVLVDSHFFSTFLQEFYSTDRSRERIAEITRVCLRNAPELLPHVDEIGEITSRFLVSILISGSNQRDEQELKDFIRRRLIPGLMKP